ncbi:MAG: class I SAM-dependent methyltransferase [Solirubrobacteraceae bacterium]
MLPDDAFERLAAAEERSFWFRSRNRLLIWALQSYFPEASSFLEVGCGNGFVLAGVARARPEIRLVGSDLSASGLERAARRAPSAQFVQTDVRELPFEGEFDVVGAFDVLEHVTDDDRALAAIRRAVRVGGGVIVTVPQHRWLWSETDRFSGHHRRYRRRELERRLSEAGLRVRCTTSFVTLLLPLMAGSRGWQSISRRPFDPARELGISDSLDKWLERVMDAECRLIRHGARFPAGGSLLAIADRLSA